MIPVIAVGFVLLAGLLLWFVIGSRGHWAVKLAAIVVSCAFTFAVWDALDSFSGWPTGEEPPARALLLASAVDEPDAIYLWLVPSSEPGWLDYRADELEPRAYRLPYSRELHRQVDLANGMAKKGRQVEVRQEATTESGRKTRMLRLFPVQPAGVPRKDASPTP